MHIVSPLQDMVQVCSSSSLDFMGCSKCLGGSWHGRRSSRQVPQTWGWDGQGKNPAGTSLITYYHIFWYHLEQKAKNTEK